MLNTYKRHQLEAQIHKPYHVFLFYISHLYMDTNTPLRLVLVALTKLCATGDTPGFKQQLSPSALLCSCRETSGTSPRRQGAGAAPAAGRGGRCVFLSACVTKVILTLSLQLVQAWLAHTLQLAVEPLPQAVCSSSHHHFPHSTLPAQADEN